MIYPRESSASRGYGSKWRKARLLYLERHPLCVMCRAIGRVTAANVVDHIKPHKGDQVLFWDMDNWQSLCKSCHDRHKQSQDRTGSLKGCDIDGTPLDPDHPWGGG